MLFMGAREEKSPFLIVRQMKMANLIIIETSLSCAGEGYRAGEVLRLMEDEVREDAPHDEAGEKVGAIKR